MKNELSVSNRLSNAFQSFKSSPVIIKFLFVFFLGSQFFRSFIFVTTNSIYKQELSIVLGPFILYSLVIQIISIIILIIYLFRIKNLSEFVVLGSFVFLIGITFLGIYGLCPCLFEHSNSLTDHIHPHSISYKIKQSFLCPSYSHNSRFHLLFCILIGCTTLGVSLSRLKKSTDYR